ncbi:MAG: winged helix-turn-helix domain-containing protein [Kangiellaceae bacterium]|nr:winged helix-turn-helix domain-containing protein [Kangiellaceae bacterium]MCW8998105.1 winged helix-turn-helix domain-containing protein [Kangiellaceae bacterium]
MAITINEWQLLENENRLRKDNKEIVLQPLCVKLLAFLANHSGEVVSREKLIENVWQGRVVSEDAINNCVKKVRKALDDDPQNPRLIQTIPKQGYRLLKNDVKSKIKFPNKIKWALTTSTSLLCLIGIAAHFHISMEVIHITSEMTLEEKQKQYQRVVDLSEEGGHIIKLDIETPEKKNSQ